MTQHTPDLTAAKEAGALALFMAMVKDTIGNAVPDEHLRKVWADAKDDEQLKTEAREIAGLVITAAYPHLTGEDAPSE